MQDRDEEHGQYQQKPGRDFSITKLKLITMESSDLCYPLLNSLKLGEFIGLVTHVYCRFSSLTLSLDFSISFLLSISLKVFCLVLDVSQNTHR